MDSSVIAALAKWPNVPAVFGWLRLDRRGNWLIRGERLHQPALTGFICRNYDRDEHGRFFFQNGPQRVYVSLDYTPWICRFEQGNPHTHTGQPITAEEILLDDEGNMLIRWTDQIALIDDRDLPSMLACLRHRDGTPVDDSTVLLAIDRQQTDLVLEMGTLRIPVTNARREDIAPRFGFDPAPSPD